MEDYDAAAEMLAMGFFGAFPEELIGPPEGEDVAAVIAVLEDWYQAIEEGTANKRMPNPTARRFSDAECAKLLRIIDEYIQWELDFHPAYWSHYSPNRVDKLAISAPAQMYRIEGNAREAFAQDVDKKLKEIFGTGLFEKGV